MSEKKKSYIGWYVVAAIFVIFALGAPYIFTRKGIIDFTETGQIGDTIQGIMEKSLTTAGFVDGNSEKYFYIFVKLNGPELCLNYKDLDFTFGEKKGFEEE